MGQLEVGQNFSLTIKITESMVANFIAISGDSAPLHTDEEFARSKGFQGCLVHGALLVSLASRFVGLHLPGPSCIWLRADSKFHAPCYAPEEIHIQGKISQISEALSSLAVDISITNSKNVVLATIKSFHKIL